MNDGKSSDLHLEQSCLSQQTLAVQSQMREALTLCDACIKLDDGGIIHVHRVILSASSEYFR